MDAADQLKQSLQRINGLTFQSFYFDQRPIQQHVKDLDFQLSTSSQAPPPPPDRIQEAITSFQSGQKVDFETFRRVCYGAITPIDDSNACLLENAQQWAQLLAQADQYREQSVQYRRCYRGLLSCYFQYDTQSSHAIKDRLANWLKLRDYLNAHIDLLGTDETTPDWVLALQEHRNVLTEKPYQQYIAIPLNAEDDPFLALQQRLGFTGASWLCRSVVEARLASVIALPDAAFHAGLPSVMRLLEDLRYATFRDQGLATLLDRYSKNNPCVFHAPLCDLAVAHWGNPWFCMSPHRWVLATDAARRMVEEWCDPDFVRLFFELFSTDGHETRRLTFWKRYAGAITDVHFALGRYALQSQDRLFVNIRKKLGARLHRLQGSGQANNALILISGQTTVVEFGVKGDAAYIHQKMPFQLEGARDLSTEALMKTQRRLTHRDNDNGYEYWEQYFDAYLYQSFRIRASLAELPEPWRSGLCLTALNPNTLNAFCEAFTLQTNDDRATGGFFWVLTGNEPPILEEQLRAWGFTYRAGKGWYWKSRSGRSEI